VDHSVIMYLMDEKGQFVELYTGSNTATDMVLKLKKIPKLKYKFKYLSLSRSYESLNQTSNPKLLILLHNYPY